MILLLGLCVLHRSTEKQAQETTGLISESGFGVVQRHSVLCLEKYTRKLEGVTPKASKLLRID